ncbi:MULTISPECIES: hypothetical protein [unclassified Luteococcus]|uniref:hypothetical protein n=1 Tax=unclassified Luteococcus TaxID=2639923 RepID=UPI00313AA1BA
MPSMNVLVIAATVVLCLLTLFWTWTRWSMGHGARVLLRGLGVVLMLVGLYLSGLMGLAGNGARSIYDWAQRTVMSNPMIIGFSLIGVGLLFWLIGTILRPRTKEQLKAARMSRRGQAPGQRHEPMISARQAAGTQPAGTQPAAKQSAPVVDDDDEVNAILNKHGIQ